MFTLEKKVAKPYKYPEFNKYDTRLKPPTPASPNPVLAYDKTVDYLKDMRS